MSNLVHQVLCGHKQYQLSMPKHTVKLGLPEIENRITPGGFGQKLHEFLDGHCYDLSRVVLVVADKTRLCGYRQYLPKLVEALETHGMRKRNLTVIIAYGTHPPQTDRESVEAYGEIFHRLRFVHHDCHMADFADLGQTSRGTPVRIRRDIMEASMLITMGAISHHYFAGFGGGRKLIFPGCGERRAINANHGLFLDHRLRKLSRGCQPGVLTGNPLAEDLFEVAKMGREPDLAVHGILDSHGTVCDLIIGSGWDTFLSACRIHATNCETVAGPFDVVVASCGGFPKDINYIQSHKTIHNSSAFVRNNGLLLVYCDCPDGVGSKTFLPWFRENSYEAAFKKLAAGYEGNGGTALATMGKLQRIEIGLVSQLDDAFYRLTGFKRYSHRQVQELVDRLEASRSIAFIPNGSVLVKTPVSKKKT